MGRGELGCNAVNKSLADPSRELRLNGLTALAGWVRGWDFISCIGQSLDTGFPEQSVT